MIIFTEVPKRRQAMSRTKAMGRGSPARNRTGLPRQLLPVLHPRGVFTQGLNGLYRIRDSIALHLLYQYDEPCRHYCPGGSTRFRTFYIFDRNTPVWVRVSQKLCHYRSQLIDPKVNKTLG